MFIPDLCSYTLKVDRFYCPGQWKEPWEALLADLADLDPNHPLGEDGETSGVAFWRDHQATLCKLSNELDAEQMLCLYVTDWTNTDHFVEYYHQGKWQMQWAERIYPEPTIGNWREEEGEEE